MGPLISGLGSKAMSLTAFASSSAFFFLRLCLKTSKRPSCSVFEVSVSDASLTRFFFAVCRAFRVCFNRSSGTGISAILHASAWPLEKMS